MKTLWKALPTASAALLLLVAALVLAFAALGRAWVTPDDLAPVAKPLGWEAVARGLENPWGMAFLPDGRILVTERPGRLRIVDALGRLSPPLAGVPKVYAKGQGGLLDVALSPEFPSDATVFLSFSEEAAGGLARTAVARAKLVGEALVGTEVIFRQKPAVSGSNHFGSRLAFDRAGNLFITSGDRFNYRDEAQNPESQLGKVLRIRPDGAIPADNPIAGSPVWSLGHRNIQGAALNPATGELWISEHGPQGGDEINVARRGANYGWPVVTWGVEYVTAFKIGAGPRKQGMEDPQRVWVPSIAPAGIAFYDSPRHPEWKGSLLVAALKYKMLVRLTLDGDRVTGEERLSPPKPQRLRDVAQGPDGSVYVLTDEEEGGLWRVFPPR